VLFSHLLRLWTPEHRRLPDRTWHTTYVIGTLLVGGKGVRLNEQSDQQRLADVPATGVERGLELVAQIALGIEMALLYLRFAELREAVTWPTFAGLFLLVAASIAVYTVLSFARRLRVSSVPYASRIREPHVEVHIRLLRNFIAFLKAILLIILGVSEWMWIQVALGTVAVFPWIFLPAGILLVAAAVLVFSSAIRRLG